MDKANYLDAFYLPLEMQQKMRKTLEPLIKYLAERTMSGTTIQMNVLGHQVTIKL